jgi:hypothetical protein
MLTENSGSFPVVKLLDSGPLDGLEPVPNNLDVSWSRQELE